MKASRVIVLFLFLAVKVVDMKKNERRDGPYKALLIGVAPCINTTYPVNKNPSFLMQIEAYNSGSSKYRLLRVNYTSQSETRDLRIKLKSYFWQSDRWKLLRLFNDVTCRGILLDLLTRTVSFKLFDTRKCAVLKGHFSYDTLDINAVQHAWTSKMEYGRTLWRYEIIVGRSTFYCWDFETSVEPA